MAARLGRLGSFWSFARSALRCPMDPTSSWRILSPLQAMDRNESEKDA
jgi:hypothetical protein